VENLTETLAIIRTKRLVLRPFSPADIDSLHALWTAPAVRQFLWDDLVISRERAAAEVERGFENTLRHGIGYWVIERDTTPGIAGFCGFRPIDQGSEIELMYGLERSCWGMGLATEASQALLEWLWRSTAYLRVFARTDPPNQRSVAVMHRVGMRFESATPTMITYTMERP
jgi:RimJ/RimL family protein N-acetyltransferase